MTYFALVSESKAKLQGALAGFNDAVSVGLTIVNDRQCLMVMIEEGKEAEIKPHIPEDVDGVAVVTSVIRGAQFLPQAI